MLTGKPKFEKNMVIPWENSLITISLYRLSPNRESKIATDTQFEMGFASFYSLRYSQSLWKHRMRRVSQQRI